jgi:hypothetical protein
VRRAIVRLASADLRGSRDVATDDQGRFVFTDLPAGRFTLSASRPGFVTMNYGAKRFRGAGSPVVLGDGERLHSLRLHLPRGAVITGTVIDALGQPTSALVMALERVTVDGRAMLQQRGTAVADDRGMYRIFGLPSGAYLIGVTNGGPLRDAMLPTTDAEMRWAAQRGTGQAAGTAAPPARSPVTFAPVFFPGVHAVDAASAVSVAEGEERAGVDFPLRFVAALSISGIVTTPDGQPAAGVSLSLTAGADGTAVPLASRGSVATSVRGEFTFSAVPPGRYVVTAQASSAGAPAGRGGQPAQNDLWLQEPVVVAGDVAGWQLSLRPAVAIRGKLVAEAASGQAPVDLARVRISATPGASSPITFTRQARVHPADSTFSIPFVPTVPYRLTVTVATAGLSGSAGWIVRSVVVNGRDVLDREFDVLSGRDLEGVVITLTDRTAELSGRLLDGQGRPTPAFAVILLPADREQWLRSATRAPRATRSDTSGVFRFEGLPPGTYYLAAATEVDTDELSNADYLEQFVAGAVSLSIALGERKVQDVRIGGS